MAEVVYALCAAASIACALLLFRGHRAARNNRLLFWSGLCFAGLALNNVLLFVDLVIVPEMDLSVWRSAVALTAMMVLLFGLVWEQQ
ncbi:MAG: DUF5985 family protein [Deltaproteobacteria bacterium]